MIPPRASPCNPNSVYFKFDVNETLRPGGPGVVFDRAFIDAQSLLV